MRAARIAGIGAVSVALLTAAGVATATATAAPGGPPRTHAQATHKPHKQHSSTASPAPTLLATALPSSPSPSPSVRISSVSPSPTPTAVVAATPTPTPTPTATPTSTAPGVPAFDHIVVVVEENHSYSETIDQPYLNSLASGGANFTDAHAETHPSQPNYIDLWAGQNYGVTDDTCTSLSGNNVGAQMLAAGKTVKGFSETLPSAGSTVCTYGTSGYAKKHNPVATFTQTAGSATNLPFTSWPSDYTTLPRLSLVVPNLKDDMHDGSVATGDTWLKNNLGGYAAWAKTHNSLLIVTFDEDDATAGNQILNVFYGDHVRTGTYGEAVNHYRDLSTIESAFGLPHLNGAAAITDVWQ